MSKESDVVVDVKKSPIIPFIVAFLSYLVGTVFFSLLAIKAFLAIPGLTQTDQMGISQYFYNINFIYMGFLISGFFALWGGYSLGKSDSNSPILASFVFGGLLVFLYPLFHLLGVIETKWQWFDLYEYGLMLPIAFIGGVIGFIEKKAGSKPFVLFVSLPAFVIGFIAILFLNYQTPVIDGEYHVIDLDGRLKGVYSYEGGKVHGDAMRFHPNGAVSHHVSFEKGEAIGAYYIYDKEGFLIGYVDLSGDKQPRTYAKGLEESVNESVVEELKQPYQIFQWEDPEEELRYFCDGNELSDENNPYKGTLYRVQQLKEDPEYFMQEKLDPVTHFEEMPMRQFYLNGEIKHEGTYVNGVLQGSIRWYHSNGKLRGEGFYEDGFFEGDFKFYDSDERLISSRQYHKGILNGFYRDFHENKLVYIDRILSNGVLNGPYKKFYENGQLESKFEVQNGLVDGDFETYWPNGVLQSRGTYEKGVLTYKVEFDNRGRQQDEYRL